MRLCWTIGAALIGCATSPASAAPVSIDCAVNALSAKQRADVGVVLADDQSGDAVTRTRAVLAKPAAACAKAGRWTDAQSEAAISWSTWDLMRGEYERRSGLGAADIAAIHAYAAENPSRIAGMAHFSEARINQLIGALRGRGAHLHDAGKDTEREIGFLLMLTEMNVEAATFARS